MRNLGFGLYDWKNDGEVTTWLQEHLGDDDTHHVQVVHVIITRNEEVHHMNNLLGYVNLIDEVDYEAGYNHKIDGTQPYELEVLMNEMIYFHHLFIFINYLQIWRLEVTSVYNPRCLVIRIMVLEIQLRSVSIIAKM
jgi:hypothetical protein